MDLTIRKLPKYMKVEPCVIDAVSWINRKYNLNIEEMDFDLIIGGGSCGHFYANCWTNPDHPRAYQWLKGRTKPAIRNGVRDTLYLYKKKTAGLTVPDGGLKIGWKQALTSDLIHELTHAVQFKQGRKYSEVETTRNQIEHLKQTNEFWYNKLIPA